MPSKTDLQNAPMPDCNEALCSFTEKLFASALYMGASHADESITHADISVSNEAMPFEEALTFFTGKASLPKEEYYALEKKLRFRAFTVSRLSECDFVEAVRGRLIAALEDGDGGAKAWADVKAIADADGSPMLPGYFETVYRTNIQSAYNAGRLMQYQKNEPPAWELLIIEDGRTSDTCKGISRLTGNGKALPSNHPFWSTYGFPPYHFNCRTTFRAVYDYEIGKTTAVENVPMKKVRKNFRVQDGFGGNPLEKESWWRLTDGMKKRIERYGIKDEVESLAKELGIENFDVRLAHNAIEKRRLHGTDFHANIVKGAEPKQHEIEIAKILDGYGYKVLFTPENKFINKMKNPEGIETMLDKIVEMKKVDSSNLNKMRKQMKEASEQHAQIAVLHLIGKKTYTEKDAVEQVEKTFKEIENENEHKSILKEVWLIIDGKIRKIKK